MSHTNTLGVDASPAQTHRQPSAASLTAGAPRHKRPRQPSDDIDALQLRRQLMRTPSPQVDRPYAIQHALPEACQPRYAARYARPVITDMRSPQIAHQLSCWQQAQSAAQTLLRTVAAPLQPALALLESAYIDEDPDGLLALRRDYAAALLCNPDTCAVDSDGDSEEDDDEAQAQPVKGQAKASASA